MPAPVAAVAAVAKKKAIIFFVKKVVPVVIILLIIVMIGFAMLIGGILTAITGAGASQCTDSGPMAISALATDGPVNVGSTYMYPSNPPSTGTITEHKMAHAQIIVQTGLQMQPPVPEKGLIIALITALVEDQFENKNGGDRDSLGLFQQRPSQGWGTPEQIMDPVYSSTKFYEGLLALPNWQSMGHGEAAQKVQRSAHPDRYERVLATGAGLVQSILPALQSGQTVLVSNPDNPQCAQYAGGGGDPSDCPPDSAIPSGSYRVSISANELCVKSVQQARTPEAGRAIIWAFHHLGIPYGRPDGKCATNTTRTGPSHYDCSGFVTSAYKDTGTDLGGNPTTALMRAGNWRATKISESAARPGDLYLPSTGHVVMLLADGNIIHTSKCGDVSNVRTKYGGNYNGYYAPNITNTAAVV